MLERLRRAVAVAALVCACPLIAVASGGQPALTKADVDAWLDGFMPYALERGDIAGGVVVVVKDGDVLTQRGYGYADVSARTPMDPERTLVRIGSVSKLFTWTALMQLVEQGKVALDADVNTYLDFTIPSRGGAAVTVRDVMTHTPGFEEQLKNIITYDAGSAMRLEEYLKRWTPELIFAPGTMPAYSNHATALAGYIVQRVSGMSFDDYMDAHVLGPLAMTSSTFRQPLPEALRERMSKGYTSPALPERPFEIFPPAPAGSMSATANDMAKFMIAHLQNGSFGESRILQSRTAETMHTTALTILPRVNRMLLGFYEADYKGRRVIAHGGDTQWFHSDLRLFIDDGVGLFVSVNSRGATGDATVSLRVSLFEQFADRYLPVPGWQAGPGLDQATALSHARLVAGRYINSRRMESSFMSLLNLVGGLDLVDYEDGTIGVSMVRDASGAPLRWREVEPFVWQLDDSSRLLTAEVKDGRVVRLAFDEYAPIMMFEPPAAWKPSLPIFLAALGAMLVTVLAWPVSALARRHYGIRNTVLPESVTVRRWLRIALAATVAMWAAWAATISTLMSDLGNLSAAADGWLWLLHASSIIVVVGGMAAGAWHVTSVIRSRQRWYAKLWSVILAMSLAVSSWVAVSYNVITSGVNY